MGDRSEIIHYSGLSETQIAPVLARTAKERGKRCVLVTASFSKANDLARTLSFFAPDTKIDVLQEEEPFFARYEAKSRERTEARLAALADLRKPEPCFVIAPVTAAIKKLPPPEAFGRHGFTLNVGDETDIDALRGELVALGFERTAFTESKGQFSIRGGILDLFAPDAEMPLRAEFFGAELDSLKYFDPESQRSVSALRSAQIRPAQQMVVDEARFQEAAARMEAAYDRRIRKCRDTACAAALRSQKAHLLSYVESATNLQLLENYIGYFYDEPAHLWDYMDDGILALDDPDRLRETVALREKEAREDFKVALERGYAIPEDGDGMSGNEDMQAAFAFSPLCLFTPFSTRVAGVARVTAFKQMSARRPSAMAGRLDVLETELRRYVEQGYETTVVCASEERLENLREFLDRAELGERVALRMGKLAAGMEFPGERKVWLREADIFLSPKKRRAARSESRNASPIKSFTDIRKGDYVVHENHGIGKFIGIEQLDIQNVKRDYLKIKYAGEDMLYIPTEQMSAVQKYIGGGDAEPKISRLSSGEWKKAKARAKRDIANLAKELLDLSAARKRRQGYAFSPDTTWQKDFEDGFPHEETGDQLRSIESVKRDMEKPAPMDRLLCGDVGYGKTEVAARAVFKCAAEGKQAAVLTPTTILANQHFHTFSERFANFPFSVEMLSRFRSAKEQEVVIEKLGKGEIDVVIGTHRLLSQDVRFKDLGLLIVDEEQRFGVMHKERIKTLKQGVDVLTLTATPIPRTLHLSLVGLRDMDLIEEPPEDRYPVQTYVMEQSDEIMRETVRRELDRDGQVYIVYNRIQGIGRVASEIKALVPEAEIAVGHGRMNEQELENVMMDFVSGHCNVLVSTTIIESGIDIPNVNTILIMDADRFGLSQLYQLRGRVGRSNRPAYAYLLYRRDKILSEAAEKRLLAIREFAEFGAGFRIAMRDLEIRGAGNLLGTEQHGHMMSIGYELYCKLVDDAVRALEGEVVNPDAEDVAFEIPVTAYLPDGYIEDETLRLHMYKRIAFVETEADERDVLDELTDRFGDPPPSAVNLIGIARARALGKRVGIARMREEGGRYVFELRVGAPVDTERLAQVAGEYGKNIFIHGGAKPFIALRACGGEKTGEITRFLGRLAP